MLRNMEVFSKEPLLRSDQQSSKQFAVAQAAW